MNATAIPIPVAPIVRRVDFDALLAGDPKMTAAGSSYAAEIWNLGVEMQALRKLPSERQLDFRMRAGSSAKYLFPEGKVLADYPAFHRHAKRLMAAMTLCPRNTRRPVYAAQSLILTLRGLRRIYCHFAREGYWSLETVPQSAFEAYVRGVSSFSCSFISTFRSLHIYRDLVPAFTFDCWRIMLKYPGTRYTMRKPAGHQTEPIPDDVFQRLLRVCLSYVQDRAGAILDAREMLASARQELPPRSHRSPYPTGDERESLWRKIAWDKLGHGTANESSVRKIPATVFTACRNLQYASVVLLFAITGMRLNELMTICTGCLKRTRDGGCSRIWIESMLSKGSERAFGDDARWLCGELGAVAVNVLERLSAPMRRESGRGYLIAPIVEGGQHRRVDPSRYTGGSAQAFFAPSESWGRFLREHQIVGADGRVAHIHTHQFRRTFARWCALSDSSTGLLALKDHFKHASILMTRYYARIDDELLLLFEAEKDRIRAESFDKVLRAEALGGIGGRLIKRDVDAAIESGELPREFRGMAGAQLRGACVKKWLQSGVQLRACAGHYCMPLDPHVTCEEAGSFGCNKGTCRNAVFHPEHAPGLAEKIRNDRRTVDALQTWAPQSPYLEELREHIRVQEKILADISKDETKTQPRA